MHGVEVREHSLEIAAVGDGAGTRTPSPISSFSSFSSFFYLFIFFFNFFFFILFSPTRRATGRVPGGGAPFLTR